MSPTARTRVIVGGSFSFREQAVDHYVSAANDNHAQLLRASPPWTWTLFVALSLTIVAALLISTVADVEVTSRGRGVLRTPGGARLLESQVSGVVVEVLVQSGQEVQAGEALLRVDSAGVQAALLEADHKVALVRSRLAALVERQQKLYDERKDLLEQRVGVLRQRADSEGLTIARLRTKAHAYDLLAGQGIVGSVARDEATEDVWQTERQRLAIVDDMTQAKVQAATLESELEADRWRWEQEVEEAETKRNALAYTLDQMTLRAPQPGCLESLRVRPGDVLQPGSAVGRLVALGAPSRIVAFLPERDRAFVAEGSDVRLEIEQLPYGEFGTVGGRVERVSSDLASPYEVREALGEEAQLPGPAYRVELRLLEDARSRAMSSRLRTGMLVNARFTLRRRRLIALVLDPLRHWFH